MNTITREKLLKAGFSEEIINGNIIYTRKGFSIFHNEFAWCPCIMMAGEMKIGNVYLDTMEELERFINETNNM